MDQPGKVANPDRGQLDRKNSIPLSPCVPENLVSRDGFSRPVPRQPAHLHPQANPGINPDYVCTYGHTYSKSIDQPDKVANPARGQLDRKKMVWRDGLATLPENLKLITCFNLGRD